MTAPTTVGDPADLDPATRKELRSGSAALVRELARPRLGAVAGVFAILVLENVLALAGPLLVGLAIDRGIGEATGGAPALLVWCTAGYLLCAVAASGVRYWFFTVAGRLGQGLLVDLRRRIFDHVLGLSVGFHDTYPSGTVISRLTADVDAVDDLVESSLDGLLTTLLSTVGITAVLLWLDPAMGLVVPLSFVPLVLLTRWYRKRSAPSYRGTRASIARITAHIVDTMNALPVVQAFRAHDRNNDAMARLNDDYRRTNTETLDIVAFYTAGVRLFGNLTLAAVLAIGVLRVADGSLELGVLTAFLLYLRKLHDPLDELATFTNTYSSAAAAMEKIAGLLRHQPTVAEPDHPARPADRRAAEGRVVFDAVSFRYGPDAPFVLSRVNLEFVPGRTVALVGATGAGKTTVAKLIARFHDPTGGAVSLDGIDLRDLAEADLRARVVLVTQENHLFSGTIAENIGLGVTDPAAIRRAARAVGLHEYIAALPQGYETEVGRHGARLSAGRRQLIGFARVFLADPAVLVLDEATSRLDRSSEQKVQHALATVLGGRTTLVIAHRLSTVLMADRVLVLDAGRVVEDGPPGALIAEGGRFSSLHENWRASTSAG